MVFQWQSAKALEKARTDQPEAVDLLFEHSLVLDLPTTLPSAWHVADSYEQRFFAHMHQAMAGYRPWVSPPWQSQGSGTALLRPPMPANFQPAFRPPPVAYRLQAPEHPPGIPRPQHHRAPLPGSRGRGTARTKKAERPGKRERVERKAAVAAAAAASATAAPAVADAVGTSTAPPAPVSAAPAQPVQPAASTQPTQPAQPVQPVQPVQHSSAVVAFNGFTADEQQQLRAMLRTAQSDVLRSDLTRSHATLDVAQRSLNVLKASNEGSSSGAQ